MGNNQISKKGSTDRTAGLQMIRTALACVFFIVSGCLDSAEDGLEPVGYHGEDSSNDKITVRFNAYVSPDGTRSQETDVGNISISVYEGGTLVGKIIPDESLTGEIDLDYGKFYRYYAAANIPPDELPDSGEEDEMKGYRVETDPEGSGTILPMAASGGFTVTGDGMTVNIMLERLYSKVNFSMDFSDVPDLTVTSVRVLQAATSVALFSESEAQSTADGDCATASEIAGLNEGKEIELLLPENCQGILLPGNTDSGKKVPENIPGKAGVCSYIEVGGEFSGTGKLKGEVVYRFYLGQDAASDFNVRRNTSMDIKLVPSGNPEGEDSWQVDSDRLYADVPAFFLGREGNIYYRIGETEGYAKTVRTFDWVKAVRGEGIHVIAANNPSGNTCSIWTSADGMNWEMVKTFYFCSITDLAYGNGTYIALTGTEKVYVSGNAKSWALEYADVDLEILTFGNGKFLGISPGTRYAYCSDDGLEWHRENFDRVTASVIEYGNDGFLGLSHSGKVFKSADGQSWDTYNYKFYPSSDLLAFNNLVYGNGKYLLGTGDSVYYSQDGISWYRSDMPARYYGCMVDFHDGIFCAACRSSEANVIFATSLDGEHWTEIWNSGKVSEISDICILD